MYERDGGRWQIRWLLGAPTNSQQVEVAFAGQLSTFTPRPIGTPESADPAQRKQHPAKALTKAKVDTAKKRRSQAVDKVNKRVLNFAEPRRLRDRQTRSAAEGTARAKAGEPIA
jgi:hypothetical protein